MLASPPPSSGRPPCRVGHPELAGLARLVPRETMGRIARVMRRLCVRRIRACRALVPLLRSW